MAALIGVIIGIVVCVIAMRKIGGDAYAQEKATAARLEALEAAKAEELLASPSIPSKKYQPKGAAMPKPVFLPTEADTLLEEDPVVEWVPIGEGDYYNPFTGEIFHKSWE